jgi:hypothetical protein
MRVDDPGHRYTLGVLDGRTPEVLRFVKRYGPKFPGNTSSYSGTTLQEVWRASIDRLKYLNNQDPSEYNDVAIAAVEKAIAALEDRAADRHGRPHNTVEESCYGKQCQKCLHVGCDGKCH